MPRKPRIPTQEEIEAIRELKEKKKSDEYIANALNISRTTLHKWKTKCDTITEHGTTVSVQIQQELKEAQKDRLQRHLELATDGVDQLLCRHFLTETQEDYQLRTNKETGEEELVLVKRRIIKKEVDPNPTMIIFTKVNRDPENWQSIHKAGETKQIDQMPEGVDVEFEEVGEFEDDNEKAVESWDENSL